MIFVDTSYLVALAKPADALHDVATEWSTVVSGPFVTTEFVLVEFVNLLSSPNQRAKAHAFVGSIYSNPKIRVVPATGGWFRRGLKLHAERQDKFWSLTDCISFEVMKEVNATDALTYDQDFEQAGIRVLLRETPPV